MHSRTQKGESEVDLINIKIAAPGARLAISLKSSTACGAGRRWPHLTLQKLTHEGCIWPRIVFRYGLVQLTKLFPDSGFFNTDLQQIPV